MDFDRVFRRPLETTRHIGTYDLRDQETASYGEGRRLASGFQVDFFRLARYFDVRDRRRHGVNELRRQSGRRHSPRPSVNVIDAKRP